MFSPSLLSTVFLIFLGAFQVLARLQFTHSSICPLSALPKATTLSWLSRLLKQDLTSLLLHSLSPIIFFFFTLSLGLFSKMQIYQNYSFAKKQNKTNKQYSFQSFKMNEPCVSSSLFLCSYIYHSAMLSLTFTTYQLVFYYYILLLPIPPHTNTSHELILFSFHRSAPPGQCDGLSLFSAIVTVYPKLDNL